MWKDEKGFTMYPSLCAKCEAQERKAEFAAWSAAEQVEKDTYCDIEEVRHAVEKENKGNRGFKQGCISRKHDGR